MRWWYWLQWWVFAWSYHWDALTHVQAVGLEVGESGTHGLSCQFSKGWHSRHAAVNDIIRRALDTANIPSHLEPLGLYHSDGKRPDSAAVVPWKCGEGLCGVLPVPALVAHTLVKYAYLDHTIDSRGGKGIGNGCT